jgi:hypothetical protein
VVPNLLCLVVSYAGITGTLKVGLGCFEDTYCTVSVRAKDCTVLPAALAAICTVEVPAGVAGVAGGLGGVLGVVLAVADPPPPHPLTTSVAASRASITTQ